MIINIIMTKQRREAIKMKKYQVEIRENGNDCWDEDAIQECVFVESFEDAKEVAEDYLREQCICNGLDFEKTDHFINSLDYRISELEFSELDGCDIKIHTVIL